MVFLIKLFKSKKSKQPCKHSCLQATKHQLVYFQTNNYSKENKYGEILFKRKLFISKVTGVKNTITTITYYPTPEYTVYIIYKDYLTELKNTCLHKFIDNIS